MTNVQKAIRDQIDAAITDPDARREAYAKAGVSTPEDEALSPPEDEALSPSAQARKAREEARGRAELNAVVEASHKAGAVGEDEFEDHLSGRALDPGLTSGERIAATRKLGSLGAKRQTRGAREKAKAESEEARAQKRAEAEEAKQARAAEAEKAAGAKQMASGLRVGALAALGVMHGITSAFGAGRELGNAAGQLAQGLDRAVTGAASGLAHVGQTILGMVLSPFGQGGAAVAGAVGGLTQGLLGVLSGAGGLAAAGLKIGVGLAGGIAGGLAVAAGAGVGGLLGGILGSVLPGGGTVAGAVLGAGIGSAVAGSVVQALAGVVGMVSGGLGQALGAIGDAFGKVGGAVGEALGSVKNVLNDLIETGGRFAQAALSLSRGGNLSVGAGAGVASLASILTGSASGLSSAFTGFGHFSQYEGYRLRAFGVAGADGADPLGNVTKAADAYRGMDPIRRELLVKGGFGGNEALGNLFSLNAQPGGAGLAQKYVDTARRTALSPREAVQDAKLSLDLAGVQAQIDRVKTQFLTALMPAITKVLGTFSTWFTRNEGKIVAGLQSIGRWLYVELPGFLHRGLDALMGFGEGMLAQVPALVGALGGVYGAFAAVVNVASTLGHILMMTVDQIKAVADPLRAGQHLKDAQSEFAAGQRPVLDPHALDGPMAAAAKWAEVARAGLTAFHGQADASYDKTFGTESKRSRDYGRVVGAAGVPPPSQQGTQRIEVTGRIDVQSNHSIDLDKMKHSVTDHFARQEVMAFQRAGV